VGKKKEGASSKKKEGASSKKKMNTDDTDSDLSRDSDTDNTDNETEFLSVWRRLDAETCVERQGGSLLWRVGRDCGTAQDVFFGQPNSR
jgi:hypothetical protein